MEKKILITGKNSYIGMSFIHYCQNENLDFIIDELNLHDDWKINDFSQYETIFHVAGIAHNSADPKLEELYYSINRDLTIEVAQKAKSEGVKQFIFMSSMIVYGNKSGGKTFVTPDTKPNPDNFYGDSKLQAEIGLEKLNDDKFKVVILRPPMIYGKGSKGNYPLLAKLSRRTPIFPNYPNNRSMLHIDNLCELIRLLIINEESGTFYPQNAELVQTSEMVRLIAKLNKHDILFTKIANPVIKVFLKLTLIKKVFGDLYYLPSMSNYDKGDYQIRHFEQSIMLTERDDDV